jgi:tagaturonate reductase
LNRAEAEKLEKAWGFEDELMIMAEPYRLWAIETSSVRAKRVLGFTEADPGAIIAPDISLFRELKLRLLNGSHTFCCGLAQLAGFTMVREAMADPVFSRFIRSLMDEEIAPAIESPLINLATAHAFASKVADRYTNPFIDHRWSNITLQYSSKMYMRNVPTLNNYIRRFAALPKRMVLGFAAFLVFMNSKQVIDDQAEVFYEAWKEPGTEARVQTILANKGLWNQDLSEIPGLAEKITEYLDLIMQDGMKKTLENFVQQI